MIDAFAQRRTLVHNLLKEIPGLKINKPEGAFYFFFDISSFFGKSYNGTTVNTATDLSLFLLDEGLIALVTGEAFGDDKCIRLSYAASEEVLKEALKRIKATLAKLN